MVKSIIKEIIIILLLLLAVILALGVLFYDYIPNNKTIPSVGTYKTSDSVEQEIAQQITEAETVLITYEITSDDLKQLKTDKSYVQGKVNPFSTYENQVVSNEESGENNTNTNTNGGANITKGNSSGGSTNTFYSNTGTK